MAKKITFSSDARAKLKSGIDQLANAVKTTLGPRGRNVVIQKTYGTPHITKDGVSVAKEIELEDPIENMGAQMVKEVASRTADHAGDGTTTATVLAQAIMNSGLKNLVAGANPIELKTGIDLASEKIVDELMNLSSTIGEDEEKIRQVATVSANHDETIGSLISDAMRMVGKEGVVTVEESKDGETYIDEVVGLQFDRGFLSPYFITDQSSMTAQYAQPKILILEDKITSLNDIVPIVESTMQKSVPLVIIAEDIDQQTLGMLVLNKIRQGVNVVAVKSPGFGERRKQMLEDIAITTGGQVISKSKGDKLSEITLDQLGNCEKIIVGKDETTIVNGGGSESELSARIEVIKRQIDEADSAYDKEQLQKRLAKLVGGVAILYVGGQSELEMKEKKDRVDDALHATRAAIEEGIVPGGGVALIRTTDALKKLAKSKSGDVRTGINIVMEAIQAPLQTIVDNAGKSGSVVVNKVLESKNNQGYDARTDKYVDMLQAGLIDPTKVTRIAIQNAASVAGMILTTDCVVNEIPKEDDSPQIPGMM